MHIFLRILLTLWLLCMIFFAVVVLFFVWNIIDISYPQYWVLQLYINYWIKAAVTAIAIVLIVVSFVLMFTRMRKRNQKSALIKNTETGAILISFNAIEDIATKHILANSAIKHAKVGIGYKESKVKLHVNLAVAEGTNIPQVLQSLQLSTKMELETLTGIEVGKILLQVEKTSQVVKARVG